MRLYGGKTGEERMRIGSEKIWTVVFTLPSFFSIFILISMLVLSTRQSAKFNTLHQHPVTTSQSST